MKRNKRRVPYRASYPHLQTGPGLVARKKQLKELYRFCVLSLFLSVFTFTCNEAIARLITRVVHGAITNPDDVKWYRYIYAGAIKILSCAAAIVASTWIVYLRWMLPEKLRVKHFMYLPKQYIR